MHLLLERWAESVLNFLIYTVEPLLRDTSIKGTCFLVTAKHWYKLCIYHLYIKKTSCFILNNSKFTCTAYTNLRQTPKQDKFNFDSRQIFTVIPLLISSLTNAAWPSNSGLQMGKVTSPSIRHDPASEMPPKPALEP